MPDSGVCDDKSHPLLVEQPHELAAAVEALRSQAKEHRRTAAMLRKGAADCTAEAQNELLAADQCDRAAELLSSRDGEQADGAGSADSSLSVDLLRHRAEEHREVAEKARGEAADLGDEAQVYEDAAEEMEGNAIRLERRSRGGALAVAAFPSVGDHTLQS